MKRFYLTGQRSFGNRGCEAIVRGTTAILKRQFGDIEAWVPSSDIRRDGRQWPDAETHGVRLAPDSYPSHARWWVNLQRLPFPFLKRAGWPFPMPRDLKETFAKVDAVLSVGGDNYSLDYRLPTPLMGLDRLAMDMGKPVILWGASVGPFEAEPHFVPSIRRHLARMHLIAARESASYDYLRDSLGLDNVIRTADPAFLLEPEPVNLKPFWPEDPGAGVLGLNISPLLARRRGSGEDLRREAARFIQNVVQKHHLGVLLVPHVIPLDGSGNNNDAVYLKGLLQGPGPPDKRIGLMDSRLNAAQIKHVIGHCRYFIGGRTHSTIAALSGGVPTVSIAYSVKAKGINRDIFGHLDYVLETSTLGAASLGAMLNRLISEESNIKERLRTRMPEVRQEARMAARRVAELI